MAACCEHTGCPDEEEFYEAEDAEEDTFADAVADASQHLDIHKAAWEGNLQQVEQWLAGKPTKQDFTAHDPHGYSVLHLAALRGHKHIVDALLAGGCPAAPRSSARWLPLECAVQEGHAAVAMTLLAAEKAQIKKRIRDHKEALIARLAQLPDFTMQLKWELISSVPGVGLLLRRYAPHDVYTIWKQGRRLRVDGTLMGMSDEVANPGGGPSWLPEWERGHFSLVYDGSGPSTKVVFMNHKNEEWLDMKAIQKQISPETDQVLKQKVEQQLSEADARCGLVESKTIKSKDFRFEPVKGWISRELTEDIDGWKAKVYEASVGLVKVTRIKLPLPINANTTWEEYLAAQPVSDRVLEVPTNPLHSAISSQAKQEAREAVAALQAAALQEAKQIRAQQQGAPATGVINSAACPAAACGPSESQAGASGQEGVAGGVSSSGAGPGKRSGDGTGQGLHVVIPGSQDGATHVLSPSAATPAVLSPGQASARRHLPSHDPSHMRSPGCLPRHSRNGMTTSTSAKYDAGGLFSDFDGPIPFDEPVAQQQHRDAPKPVKRMTGKCWMAEGFPLSLHQLLPLLDAISTANKHMAKVSSFMSRYGDRAEFPVKVHLPLMYTLSISLQFKKFKFLSGSSEGHPGAPSSDWAGLSSPTSAPAPAAPSAATSQPGSVRKFFSGMLSGSSAAKKAASSSTAVPPTPKVSKGLAGFKAFGSSRKTAPPPAPDFFDVPEHYKLVDLPHSARTLF